MTLKLVPLDLDDIDWSLTDMLLTHLLGFRSQRTMNDDTKHTVY